MDWAENTDPVPLEGAGGYSQAYLLAYRGNVLVAVCGFMIALESITVLLRIYAKYLVQTTWGWDDVFIPAAWLANLGLNIVCINAVYKGGVGRHFPFIEMFEPWKISSWAKSVFALDWLYLASAALPKLAIIQVYLRIFTDRWARISCHALTIFLVAVWVSYLIATSCQCIPLQYQWDKTIPGGHCFNVEGFYQSTSVPNLFSDVVIAILPIPTIVRLHASISKKLGLLIIFMTGSMGIIGSCFRMATWFRSDAFEDNTWVSVDLMSWSVVEPGMYLVAACLLNCRPILKQITRFVDGRKHSTSSSGTRDKLWPPVEAPKLPRP